MIPGKTSLSDFIYSAQGDEPTKEKEMTNTDLIEELEKACGCSFSIQYQPHNGYYKSIRDYLLQDWHDDVAEIEPAIVKCEAAGTLWEITFYENNPVGQSLAFGPTLAEVCRDVMAGVQKTGEG